jgi:hypothetical protein
MIFVTYESYISRATLFNFKNKPTQFTIKRDERKTGKERKKKILETHWNSDDDTIDIIEKISTGRIQ